APGMSESTADYQTQVFNIPEFRIDRAMKSLMELSKKAQQLGMPPFEIEQGDAFFVKANGQYGITGGKLRIIPLTVTGGAPVIAGWRFFAKIEHDETMNIVQGFGAENAVTNNPELLKSLQNCPPNCDHCNLKRSRNVTYLF